VHHRQPQLLRRMLLSLASQAAVFEVIIVNVSADVDLEIPSDLPFEIRVVTTPNRGYADGCNRGFAVARGEYVAASNVDLEFGPSVLSKAMDYLDLHPEAAIVAPWLLNPDGTPQHSARRFYTWPVAVWARSPLRPLFQDAEFVRRHLMIDEPFAGSREVDWVTGALMFIRREALADPKRLFDDRYCLYMEDVDLCWDMWRRGWKVVQLQDLEVLHRYSRASRHVFSRAGFEHGASFIKFVWKHGGLPRRRAQGARTTSALAAVS